MDPGSVYYNHAYRNPRAPYKMGPQMNAFTDQPLPLLEDPYNDYGKRYLQQQEQKKREVLNYNIPVQEEETDYTVEDIGSIQSIRDIQKGLAAEPIFRVYSITANNKYAINNNSSGSKMQWNLAPYLNASTSGSLQIQEELIKNIVEVSLEPFDIPDNIFTSDDTFYGYVGLRLDSFTAPSLTNTDYNGPPSTANVIRYHYQLKLTPSSRPGRITCTPVNASYRFPNPTTALGSLWEFSFVSPLRSVIPLQQVVWVGQAVAGTVPLQINTGITGIATGDEITIETIGLNIGTYIPSTQIFSVTVLTPTSFTVAGLTGVALTSNVSVQFTIMTRAIRAVFRIISLDTLGSINNSTRSILTS